jgi:hypothetical protein
MYKKNKSVSLITKLSIIIVSISLIVLSYNSFKDKKVKRVHEFPSTIEVINTTKHDVDTITKILLNKVMGYDTMKIIIAYIPPSLRFANYDIYAFIKKHDHEDKTYFIYLSHTLESYLYKDVMAHELIHIEQFEKGNLSILDNDFFIFKNDTFSYKKITYTRRPHEIEALSKQKTYINLLKSQLYM